MKVNKTKKANDNVEEEVAEEVAEIAAAPISALAAAPEVAPERAIAEVSQKPTEGHIRVTMLETINCPTVGHWDGARVLKIREMRARESYTIPRDVAYVLFDARKAVPSA
jgi:hypothetical protein